MKHRLHPIILSCILNRVIKDTIFSKVIDDANRTNSIFAQLCLSLPHTEREEKFVFAEVCRSEMRDDALRHQEGTFCLTEVDVYSR